MTMKKTTISGLLAAAAFSAAIFASAVAEAQVPDAQTGTAFPGRVEDQFQSPRVMPRSVPRIEVREVEVEGAPDGADKVSFTLGSLALDGVTVYDADELSPVYAASMGQTITLADLYAIAADITRKYRNDGYILTQVIVPPQTIESGTARLQVVEGYVDRVQVKGDESDDEMALITALANRAKTDGRAVNVRNLERALLLINDLPGMDARGVLSPSRGKPGAADLLVIVERDPYDALVSVDNFGTAYLGPWQIGAAGSMNSPFGYNERITGQVAVAPEDGLLDFEMAYLGGSYEIPIFKNGMSLEVFANTTDTEPGFDLGEFDVKGRSNVAGLRVKHPVIRSRATNLTTRATFDYRNVRTKNNIEDTRKDRIRALRLGARMEHLSSFIGTSYNTADIEFARGIDVFGATEDRDPNVSRVGAEATFFKMEAEFQRLQRLGPAINLLLGVTGQWADDALLASEEFGVGGINYGRGYDSSEIIGDDGIAGKVEVQWNQPYQTSLVSDYQVYGFYDIGKVWNTDATAANLEEQSLASTGVGVRAEFNEVTSGGLMIAWPLTRDVQTKDDRDPRVYVNVSRDF